MTWDSLVEEFNTNKFLCWSRNELLNLNRFLFENKIDFTNIEKGKQFYNQLSEMSDKIINIARKDMLNLSDLKFLRKQGKTK